VGTNPVKRNAKGYEVSEENSAFAYLTIPEGREIVELLCR
jgi:hypothetical protein